MDAIKLNILKWGEYIGLSRWVPNAIMNVPLTEGWRSIGVKEDGRQLWCIPVILAMQEAEGGKIESSRPPGQFSEILFQNQRSRDIAQFSWVQSSILLPLCQKAR